MIDPVPRRLISAILLLGFSLVFAAPMFALYEAQSAKMSCCRRGQGSCCHNKRQTGPGFAASTECSRQCSVGVVTPPMGGALAPSPESVAAGQVFHSHVFVAEEIHSRSTSYLAFLYQLPPPCAAR
jgi:hypothetical protein